MKNPIIGIMGAMLEEVTGVIALVENPVKQELGMRTYYQGKINGVDVVVVFSRWGKVAAATTISTLITEFHITELIFTGVAGAIAQNVKVGDMVLAKRVMQHDMDSRPLLPQYVIPLHKKIFFENMEEHLQESEKTITEFLTNQQINQQLLEQFNITNPKLWIGDIASGDQFFSSNEQKKQLADAFPTVLCVEMEGAAVAQICTEYNIPWTIIRTISDSADDNSSTDFQRFIEEIASVYAVEVIKLWVTPQTPNKASTSQPVPHRRG
ncbi:MAG: 5'-methylthioadenosine/adenosylhomocysteine nucleosidase [Bacteroidales bacterium]|jgi:adenosylhomocysteine nucleosidase|nr:5'-methylthioadenosine/adenosylhomocysteine nucleosidase [Bacteroidales bacterium]